MGSSTVLCQGPKVVDHRLHSAVRVIPTTHSADSGPSRHCIIVLLFHSFLEMACVNTRRSLSCIWVFFKLRSSFWRRHQKEQRGLRIARQQTASHSRKELQTESYETFSSAPSPQWSSSCFIAAPTPPITAPSHDSEQWCCVVPLCQLIDWPCNHWTLSSRGRCCCSSSGLTLEPHKKVYKALVTFKK